MPLFTIYDLVLLVIIAIVLFIFLKPKGVLAGIKIMSASLRIFANHKVMFLQNALFLIFVHIVAPVILIATIYGVAITLNIATDKINISFLHNFIAIANLIWMFGSLIIAVISYPLLISFAYIVFYRQLLQIITEDGLEKKLSFKEIIIQEIKNFSKMLKFFLALVSVIITIRIEAFLMMIRFWFSDGRFNLSRYFSPYYAKQLMCYVPMEYALYHNSSKQAIIKSYQINREWTSLSIYGVAVSFLLGMIPIFFIVYIINNANDLNVLLNMEMLAPVIAENFGATSRFIFSWSVFLLIIFCISVPLKMLINSFYFIVYLNYNNSIIEGKTDKFTKDFGLFGSFLDSVSELLAKKFGSEPIPIYEEYIPIKEKYKKMVKFNFSKHKISVENEYKEINKSSLDEYKISVEEKKEETTKPNFSKYKKYKKLFQKKSVLVIIFLMLSISAYYFIATDKFAHPISPDFSTIPECSSLSNFDRRKEVFCQVKKGVDFKLIYQGHRSTSQDTSENTFPKIQEWGGCYLEDILYDKKYIKKLESEIESGWRRYKFRGIKKGYTEIITIGTCRFDKKFKIFIR